MRIAISDLRRVSFWLAVGVILLQASPASAVHAFARKYQTPRQTCHTIFPKLYLFGQAFRLNGYFMPMEIASRSTRSRSRSGPESYERMWPEMVFPSDLPGNVLFALDTKK